jgi:hypothetical protein
MSAARSRARTWCKESRRKPIHLRNPGTQEKKTSKEDRNPEKEKPLRKAGKQEERQHLLLSLLRKTPEEVFSCLPAFLRVIFFEAWRRCVDFCRGVDG